MSTPEMLGANAVDALAHLSNRYWAQADGVEPLELAELFYDDGILELGPLRLNGIAAIESFFLDREVKHREAQRVTRHIATNFMVTRLADDRCRLRSSVMVFAGNGDLPLPIAAPTGLADFEDECRFDQRTGWRFTRRSGVTVFVGEGAPSFAR